VIGGQDTFKRWVGAHRPRKVKDNVGFHIFKHTPSFSQFCRIGTPPYKTRRFAASLIARSRMDLAASAEKASREM
jgi:hypothetical protein